VAILSVKRRDIFIFLGGLLLGGLVICVAIAVVWWRGQYALSVVFSQPVKFEVKQADPKPPAPSDGALDFAGEDIHQALRRLGRAAGVNLVVSDGVTGTVNMDLSEHTPQEAIEIIVEAKGLVMAQGSGENPILYIKTQEEKAREPTEAMAYQFKNARAADVKKLLIKQLHCEVEPQVDERTNTIFYRENSSHIAAIQKFLDYLDQPVGPQQLKHTQEGGTP
jgi:type II secretory pathway component GspD/PulD (secretin)